MSIYDKASLVLIPSGTKTSKVFSQKPVNGDGDFTFSRSTAATRVNADGNIEKETQNLLLQSNTFDTTWVPQSGITLTANQAGYDGSSDAWKLEKNASSYRNIRISVSVSGVYTTSVYAKAGTLNLLTIRDGSNQYARFYLSTGTYTLSNSPVSGAMVDVGNGWYRCSVTMTTSNPTIQIYPDWNQTTAGYIYIQDAQLEQGLVARDYIETTTAAVEGGITDNVPRLDYTDSSCPALLLEPQRTNVIPYSEYYPAATRVNITQNSVVSPEGVNNAASVVATSVNGSHEVTISPLISIPNTNTRTFSTFAKYNGNHLILNVAGSPANWTGCVFDLQNGVAKTPQQSGAQLVCTTDIKDYGNGWYRCSITFTPYGGYGFYHLISLTNDVNATLTTYGADEYIGDDVSGIYLYGRQLEQASYATSYIPTYGTSVTRLYDYLPIKSGMQNFLGTDTGTWFFHINDMFFDITGTGVGSFILTYTGTQLIEVIQDGNDQYKITLNNSVAAENLDGEDKVAISWSSSGLVIYVNGSSVYTTTSTAYSNAYSSLEINKTTRPARVDLKQMMLFPTRLSNEELAALTTI